MASSAAEALADMILKKPRKYKATTLGRLLNLTREEFSTHCMKTIRPVGRTDEDVKEDRRRNDRESKAAKRAATESGLPRGRPRSKGSKPWQLAGFDSKATYYRWKKAGWIDAETKNASALLEDSHYSADTFSVSRPETTPSPNPVAMELVADSRAPTAPRRLVPGDDVIELEVIKNGVGFAMAPPPPPTHLQRVLASLKQQQVGVR
jgi:hypothetical protein